MNRSKVNVSQCWMHQSFQDKTNSKILLYHVSEDNCLAETFGEVYL